jgi:amino acid transporter
VQGLRRSLRFWGALALGLAIMAPTLALSLNGSAPAADVGRAVPLVFLLGGIGMAFVAFGFAVLTRRFNHSGSAYALVGATLGSRAGFFSGFALGTQPDRGRHRRARVGAGCLAMITRLIGLRSGLGQRELHRG